MIKNAIATPYSGEKPIVYFDRGCHYRWLEWIKIMEDADLTRFMSKKGCSLYNSACEKFFGHLKTECSMVIIGILVEDTVVYLYRKTIKKY